MVDYSTLVEKVLQLLSERIESNYRIAVIIVGPPGSGKSTISEKLCEEINSRFKQYLFDHKLKAQLQNHQGKSPDICKDIPEADPDLKEESSEGVFDHVEDSNYAPRKFTANDGSTVIVGRGGLPNSIRVKSGMPSIPSDGIINIAQMVPMDGFHLSRECLDHFSNPLMAHQRRGSPHTFDSNNYIQLCKLLARTCDLKPHFACKQGDLESLSVFDKLCASYSASVPSIYFPGFDHSVKDPTRDQHCVSAFTRVVVMEGLYLLLDEENWRDIYPIMKATNALLVWNIDIDEDVVEQRVAKRHLKSGLATTLDEGLQRFRENDLLNARTIKAHSITSDDIITIRND